MHWAEYGANHHFRRGQRAKLREMLPSHLEAFVLGKGEYYVQGCSLRKFHFSGYSDNYWLVRVNLVGRQRKRDKEWGNREYAGFMQLSSSNMRMWWLFWFITAYQTKKKCQVKISWRDRKMNMGKYPLCSSAMQKNYYLVLDFKQTKLTDTFKDWFSGHWAIKGNRQKSKDTKTHY